MTVRASLRRLGAFAVACACALLVASACAPPPPLVGQPAAELAGGCVLTPADSARLAAISASVGARVYDRCEVDRSARRLSAFFRRTPQVTPTASQPCLEVALEFVVGPDGRVLPAPLVATATNSPRFAKEILGRYGEWRFSPAVRKGEKVRQLVQDTAWFAFVPTVNGRPVPTTDRPRCNRY